jgi:hypothetical protein
MKHLVVLIAALTLGACSMIATKDIDQALGLAKAANDQQGIDCLNAQRLIFGAEPIGIFTVAEQARLMQRAVSVCGGVMPTASMVTK